MSQAKEPAHSRSKRLAQKKVQANSSERRKARAIAELDAFVEFGLPTWREKRRGTRPAKSLADAFRSLEDVRKLKSLLLQYDRLVARAYRVGATDHPHVLARLVALQAVGDRAALRRTRGAERGLPRPLSSEELVLWKTITDAQDSGQSWVEIRQHLSDTGLYKRSRQAFHKLCSRLEIDQVASPPHRLLVRDYLSHLAVAGVVASIRALHRTDLGSRDVYKAEADRVMDSVQERLQSFLEALRAEEVPDVERFAAKHPRPEEKP